MAKVNRPVEYGLAWATLYGILEEVIRDREKVQQFIKALSEAVFEAKENLATKEDLEIQKLALQRDIERIRAELTERIEQVRAELTERIEQVRAELTERIERVKSDLLKWIIGLFTPVYISLLLLVMKALKLF